MDPVQPSRQLPPHARPSAFAGLETSATLGAAQIDALARALLGELSLDEKIGMMSGDRPFFEGAAHLAGGGYRRHPLTTAGSLPRLGIPGLRFADGPRGLMLAGATTFPVAMARGASWDPQLECRIGSVMGREARAHGANMIGAPCINLLRHPAWGRAQEGYGEDTHHLGEMGAALTRGIQQHVMSCAKHFALNSMENARFTVDVQADERALHEVYLPHFKRVVDEGVASLMSAYNSVNGEWAGQNRALLTGILQQMWGFEGFVQTDWVWGMRDGKQGALAGQHLEMPLTNLFARQLPTLIEQGEVSESVVDDAVLRILRQQLRFAQGRDPQHYPQEIVGCQAHLQLAREAAIKGMVLLKNEGNILPLRGVGAVALIGRFASAPNTGDLGSSSTQPAHVVTPLQGLLSAADAHFNITHSDASSLEHAKTVARLAEVAVCVVGLDFIDEGEYVAPTNGGGPWNDHFPQPTAEEAPTARLFQERMAAGTISLAGRPLASRGGDRRSLRLRAEDEALIAAVAAENPRTIVCILAGSAVITEAWRDKVAGILMLWYPGQEGGHAFADVLLGKASPGGRLPCSFPKREEDLPFFDRDATQITYDLWHGYRKLERDGAEPAFPFGFGLSYTSFALGGLRLARTTIGALESVVVTLEVSNTGDMAGEEVVQLYIGARSSAVERAPKELKAFSKVPLAAGERRVVRMAVPARELAYFSSAQGGWVIEPGEYEVFVGRHSQDAGALRAMFCIA